MNSDLRREEEQRRTPANHRDIFLAIHELECIQLNGVNAYTSHGCETR